MKAFLTILALALAALAAIGRGYQSPDPAELLKQITEFRTQKINELRNSGQPLTAAGINGITAAAKDKAKAAVKGVDPAKIDPKQGFAWAQLFSMAEMHKEACDSAGRYLETKPEAKDKFAAQSLMMRSCNELGEAHMLVMMIGDIVPPTASDAMMHAMMTAQVYAETISGKMGLDEALKAIDKVETQLPPASAVDEKTLPRLNQTIAMLAQSKSEMLTDAGRLDEALATLDKALTSLPASDPNVRMVKAGKTRLTMKGKPAPALTIEKSYGEFKGLESLKGKVVMLDFFAHWCGPCIASFGDMKKLYEDFKPKGLEIVQITTYYGYYKRENVEKRDMARDVEYGKMGEFIAEHQLPWPVAYGERANFEAYGITGIPHVTLLDRKGNVRVIKIGYSAESFAKFRKEVEELLEEK